MQIDIVAQNAEVPRHLKALILRRAHYALGRFADAVRRVRIRLSDENGPRGGMDKRCLLDVKLARSGSLQIDVKDEEFMPALSRAMDRAARRIHEKIDRHRTIRRRSLSRSKRVMQMA